MFKGDFLLDNDDILVIPTHEDDRPMPKEAATKLIFRTLRFDLLPDGDVLEPGDFKLLGRICRTP